VEKDGQQIVNGWIRIQKGGWAGSGVTMEQHGCKMPGASGGLLGSPASELKTLKIYISAKYNYL
jgi:hypothetical protein